MVTQLISKLTITSTVFSEGEIIPQTFINENINPPLNIARLPDETKSICIIIESPDLPTRLYDKWMFWNINLEREVEMTSPFMMSRNATTSIKYGDPSISTEHCRFYFYVYALNKKLSPHQDITNIEMKNVMQEYIIADGSLMGIYEEMSIKG